jgi:hypothetical protein
MLLTYGRQPASGVPCTVNRAGGGVRLIPFGCAAKPAPAGPVLVENGEGVRGCRAGQTRRPGSCHDLGVVGADPDRTNQPPRPSSSK